MNANGEKESFEVIIVMFIRIWASYYEATINKRQKENKIQQMDFFHETHAYTKLGLSSYYYYYQHHCYQASYMFEAE
jgi:hypothetical protein